MHVTNCKTHAGVEHGPGLKMATLNETVYRRTVVYTNGGGGEGGGRRNLNNLLVGAN